MSLSKNVDLKCSETLRDSPPPPPPQPQLQVQPSLGSTSVFASSTNPPSHQSQHQSVPPLMTTGSSGTAFGQLPSQQQAPTVSLLVRKFDSQCDTSPVETSTVVNSSGKTTIISSNATAATTTSSSSLSFGIANVVSVSFKLL